MAKVSIEQSTLDYYMAECAAIHAICDREAIPNEDGISMSQRVAVLAGVLRGLIHDLGKNPPVSIQ